MTHRFTTLGAREIPGLASATTTFKRLLQVVEHRVIKVIVFAVAAKEGSETLTSTWFGVPMLVYSKTCRQVRYPHLN